MTIANIQWYLSCSKILIGVLGLQEFWVWVKFVQGKFMLVKLFTSPLIKFCTSENFSTCYQRNGLFLKIHACENCASQGPPIIGISSVIAGLFKNALIRGCKPRRLINSGVTNEWGNEFFEPRGFGVKNLQPQRTSKIPGLIY